MPQLIRIYQHGGPHVLRIENVDVEPPLPGEVQIMQTAIGLNFVDTYYRSGLYSMVLPSGLGMEAAGSVVAVGPGTNGFVEGEKVAYVLGPQGAYAQLRNVAASTLVKLPAHVSPAMAASVLLKGLTAEVLLFRLQQLMPGSTLLVTAAAGGVGSLLCYWARAHGIRVLGVVGRAEKKQRALSAGCEEVWLQGESFSKGVRELTGGQGVDVVLDGVGRATFQESLCCLKPRGRMVSYGNASGAVEPVSPLELASRGSLTLVRPRIWDYIATRSELEAGAAHVFEALAKGHIHARAEQSWPLHEAAKAHEALESRQTKGLSLLYT
ncbi:MAG: quinone oxidoreductase [Proteobacteria bacterium]|nr:quinone oxidoreductase [Cystobacterineae bacterium]MCL2259206.1 quinone oxidoreductase [Cystobacterineae bacterium]MCL2314469.1 quinone oxidoreductase [Pseudomonadota bacterium]